MVDQPSAGGTEPTRSPTSTRSDELDRLRDEAQTEDPARRARALARLAVGLQDKQRPAEALEAVDEAPRRVLSPPATRRARCCVIASPPACCSGSVGPLDASKRLAAARRRLLDGSDRPGRARGVRAAARLRRCTSSVGLQDVVGLLVSARELYTKADLAPRGRRLRQRPGRADGPGGRSRPGARPLRGRARVCLASAAASSPSWRSTRRRCCGTPGVSRRPTSVSSRPGRRSRRSDVEVEVAWCDQNLGRAGGRLGPSATRPWTASSMRRIAIERRPHWTAVAWCDANLALVLDALGRRRRPSPSLRTDDRTSLTLC